MSFMWLLGKSYNGKTRTGGGGGGGGGEWEE